ncbi:MAG: DUF3488 domain-containing protein [Caldilineaceae bacterium]|nr:DUF3488 domain-containing protein [Caldilineaceae bacterium]
MASSVSSVSSSAGVQQNDQPFRYTHNIYFEDGLLLTGILSALLFLTVAASLDAAGYVDSMGLLIPVTLGALAMSLLMAYSRFDSFFAFSHGMFTGLAWILYLMSRLVTVADNSKFLEYGFPQLQANVYFVLYKLLNWTQLVFQGQATPDNYMFIFEISFLVWWLTYLGIWSIYRYGYTWRAIIPAGIVLLINTYYAPQSIIAFLVFFAFVSLILLVRTNLAEQQVRWRTHRTYFSQDISLDFMRTGFTYSLLVLLLAWLAPGLGRSAPVRDLLRPVNTIYEDINAQLNDLYPNLVRQMRPTTAAFGNTLSLGGERNVGDKIIFTVDALQGRYWRAVVFDTFDGRQWQNTTEDAENFDAEVPLPIANWQLREPITQTITLEAPTGDVVFGAPDLFLTNLPLDAVVQPVTGAPRVGAATAGTEDTPAEPVELTYVRSRRTLEVGSSYTVISYQTAVTERALREAGTDYPAAISEKYLQLPEDFSPRVTAFAQEVISETFGALAVGMQATVFEQTKAVEQRLRRIPYNDAIAAPPSDVDPIEYFLFDIQEGYCDYYATAMVTMLRTLGIPARTASGYAEGVYDEEAGLYLVREEDAHTWVEVYFPSYGWIEFEPTPGESSLNRPSGEDALPANDPLNPANNDVPDFNEPPFMEDEMLMNQQFGDGLQDEFLAGDNSGFGGWPWWVWMIVTPLVLVLGLWGLRFLPGFRPLAFTADLPAIYYERLQRWTQRLGIRFTESDTPYEQGQRLGRIFPEGRSGIRQIVHAYVLHRFRPQQLVMTGGGRSLFPDNSQDTVQDAVQNAMKNAMQDEGTLNQSWKQLTPIFWKAWLRRFYATVIRRRSNPFVLHKE